MFVRECMCHCQKKIGKIVKQVRFPWRIHSVVATFMFNCIKFNLNSAVHISN